jgi:hypothetical protein
MRPKLHTRYSEHRECAVMNAATELDRNDSP